MAEDPLESFRLMGEDLLLVSGPELRAASAAWEAELERAVPPELRTAFEAEHRAWLTESHAFLREHNRNLHSRVAGYLALGRRCAFEYPWPVVAVLGICTVLDGMTRMRVFGLLGRFLRAFGLDRVEREVERIDDLLRRTNRGILADSAPVALLALRCHALRRAGRAELARALLAGPLPPLLDGECRALATRLADGLAIHDGAERFRALAELTVDHFAREQAVFSHHLRAPLRGAPPPYPNRWAAWVATPRTVRAPQVVRGRLRFAAARLPAGFDIRAHGPRVEAFTTAFVRSITGSGEDYAAAVAYALRRFDQDPSQLSWPAGGTLVL